MRLCQVRLSPSVILRPCVYLAAHALFLFLELAGADCPIQIRELHCDKQVVPELGLPQWVGWLAEDSLPF